jgi:hypothetical protein
VFIDDPWSPVTGWGSLGLDVPLHAPVDQGLQDGDELSPLPGQRVTHLNGRGRDHVTGNEVVLLELLETHGEHSVGDALNEPTHLGEPLCTPGNRQQDRRAPLTPGQLRRGLEQSAGVVVDLQHLVLGCGLS